MKILVMNWRDIKNPAHGGAEIVTHEHMKRWVKAGHECYLIASAFPSCKKIEEIEGYTIYRGGNRFTVYWNAYKIYKKYFKGKVDFVIDEINTIPFFTPFYVKEKKMTLIHQLCREIWFYETIFPFSLIGYLAEPLYLRLYKKYSSMVVSESTKNDLIIYGFKNISIIPEGINFKPLEKVPKKEKNTLIYVGRLKKSKRVHHIIEALKSVKEKIPSVKLWIVGNGDLPYKKYLEKLIKKNNLENNVKFLGYLGFIERNKLMGKAEAIIVTSVKEGWGLIVPEANAFGTPAIVYDVDGLMDAVRHNETGLIAKKNNPESLAEVIVDFLKNPKLKSKLSKNALEYSREFSWDKSAEESLMVIER
ncbi:MAG: glycosyltransferase family 4 protein [Nanoarchaeota archaeon]